MDSNDSIIRSTPERRIFERFSTKFPAKEKDSRDDFGAAMSLRDYSAQGIKFISKERYYINDIVSLEIELPDGMDPMNIKGQVIWAKQREDKVWEIGLKFSKPNLMRGSRIYKYAV